jgi:hypothetical protein
VNEAVNIEINPSKQIAETMQNAAAEIRCDLSVGQQMVANDPISILVGSLNIQIHVYVNTCIFEMLAVSSLLRHSAARPTVGFAARTNKARDFRS